MCVMKSSNRGTHLNILFSLSLSLTRGTSGEVFFLQQDVGIVVSIELPRHINIVNIVKVGRSSNHSVILQIIGRNNKLEDWDCACVRQREGVFSSYPIWDIHNNCISILTEGFWERFNTIAIKFHEGLEFCEAFICNPEHGWIGGYFHVCGDFKPRAVLVVCNYWYDCFSPFSDIITFLIYIFCQS